MSWKYAIVAAATILARGGSATAQPSANVTTEVFFDFDSARLHPSPGLVALAEWSRQHPGETIVLGGHADPRGAGDYNVGLSIRRAEAVQDQLIALGVDPDHVVIAAYGKDGARRSTYAEDRRVTASTTDQPLYAIIDRRLDGAATAVVWTMPVTEAMIEPPSRAQNVASR